MKGTSRAGKRRKTAPVEGDRDGTGEKFSCRRSLPSLPIGLPGLLLLTGGGLLATESLLQRYTRSADQSLLLINLPSESETVNSRSISAFIAPQLPPDPDDEKSQSAIADHDGDKIIQLAVYRDATVRSLFSPKDLTRTQGLGSGVMENTGNEGGLGGIHRRPHRLPLPPFENHQVE